MCVRILLRNLVNMTQSRQSGSNSMKASTPLLSNRSLLMLDMKGFLDQRFSSTQR